jgi:RimJ/RimL family protein N-acetyltransferase
MRAALAAHRLSAEQQRFVAPAVESLPLGDADPDRLSVAILVGKEPVGMFALDRGGYFREFDSDPQAVLLRAFYVASERQRRGYARAAVAAVPDFVRYQLPDVRRVVLTVNHENPTAIRTYLAGGFTDTGEDYMGGVAGPQRVFELGAALLEGRQAARGMAL